MKESLGRRMEQVLMVRGAIKVLVQGLRRVDLL